jgi:hypothetical protein
MGKSLNEAPDEWLGLLWLVMARPYRRGRVPRTWRGNLKRRIRAALRALVHVTIPPNDITLKMPMGEELRDNPRTHSDKPAT